MDQTELLALFDREQRIDVVYNDSVREEVAGLVHAGTGDHTPSIGGPDAESPSRHPRRPILVRHRPRISGFGFIVYSRLAETDADAVIVEQIDYFRRLNCPFEWKVYSHDTPPDLPERLQRHGLQMDERESVMVLDLADGAAHMGEFKNSHNIRKITTPDDIDLVIAVENDVWQREHETLGERLRLDLLETPDELSIYIAYLDDEPAATAWIYFHPGTAFASLWGGSTLERYRGRGLYSALLQARAAEAIARGFRFLTVDAGDMSRPILERNGFIHLTNTAAFKWTPDEASPEGE